MESVGTEKKIYNDPTANAVLRKVPTAGEIWVKKEYDGTEQDFLVIAATSDVAHGVYIHDIPPKSAFTCDFVCKTGERCFYDAVGVLRCPTRYLSRKVEELAVETTKRIKGQINAYMGLVESEKADTAVACANEEKDGAIKSQIDGLKMEIARREGEVMKLKEKVKLSIAQKEAYKEILLEAVKRGYVND